tara:strand:+ start:34186 stop:34620 length:435 start_codon:yes stop_codon:yes gene_type:complete
LDLTLLETASVGASWTFFGIFDAGVGDMVSRGGRGTAGRGEPVALTVSGVRCPSLLAICEDGRLVGILEALVDFVADCLGFEFVSVRGDDIVNDSAWLLNHAWCVEEVVIQRRKTLQSVLLLTGVLATRFLFLDAFLRATWACR